MSRFDLEIYSEQFGSGTVFESKRLSSRLFWLIAGISALPLLIFSGVAVQGSIHTAKETARNGLLRVAEQVAGRIDENITSYMRLVNGLGETIERPFLDQNKRKALLNAYTLRFTELKRASVISKNNTIVMSNDPEWTVSDIEELSEYQELNPGEVVVSDLVREGRPLPTVRFMRRLNSNEYLSVEIGITHLWKMIDEIQVGETGYAFLVDSKNNIMAHGTREGKKYTLDQIGKSAELVDHRLPLAGSTAEYENVLRRQVVGASHRISKLGWLLVVEQSRKEAYASATFLMILLAAIFFILLICMTLLGTQGSQRIVRPIEDLVRATKEVARGNLKIRVPVYGDDERAQLGHAFNEMVQDLENMQKKIAERERMSLVGRIASELVHDLRHPVRNLENAVSLLQSRGSEKEIQNIFQRVATREFQGLNRFLTNLEQLISNPELQYSVISIKDEVSSLLDAIAPVAKTRRIHLHLVQNDCTTKVFADPFAIRRILQNIVRNAIEASPTGSEVLIHLQESDHIEVAISDEGPGIPQDELSTLFNAFRTTKRRGMGLGLAICQKLTLEMGGEIHAMNLKQGGARFLVRFKRWQPNHSASKDLDLGAPTIVEKGDLQLKRAR